MPCAGRLGLEAYGCDQHSRTGVTDKGPLQQLGSTVRDANLDSKPKSTTRTLFSDAARRNDVARRSDRAALADWRETGRIRRMEVIALQSGSSGNCIYVEAAGQRLLFDAGISGRQAEQRLAAHGRDIRDVDALVISHDHRDHAQGIGIYQRKFGIPVHVTADTLAVVR